MKEPVSRLCRLFLSEREVAELFTGDHTRVVADDSNAGVVPGTLPLDGSQPPSTAAPLGSPGPAAARSPPASPAGRASTSVSPTKASTPLRSVAGFFRAAAPASSACLGCKTRIPGDAAFCGDCAPQVRARESKGDDTVDSDCA